MQNDYNDVLKNINLHLFAFPYRMAIRRVQIDTEKRKLIHIQLLEMECEKAHSKNSKREELKLR